MGVQVPASLLVRDFGRDAAAADGFKNFTPAKASEISDVFTNRASGQNRKIRLCGDKVLWLADSLGPGLNQLLPFLCDSPLTSRTPFYVTSRCEFFDASTVSACPVNFLRTAQHKIIHLPRGVEREDFCGNCLVEDVRVTDELPC